MAEPAVLPFNWQDPFDLNHQLTDEESEYLRFSAAVLRDLRRMLLDDALRGVANDRGVGDLCQRLDRPSEAALQPFARVRTNGTR